MSLKTWILRKMNGLTTRADLPRNLPRSPVLAAGELREWPGASSRDARQVPGTARVEPIAAAPHLGPYAPLIEAIRDELEQFVTSYLRLHLAIAERDRYLLTSIAVRATGTEDDAELLRRFVREFRPEQIKSYIAKEIVAALPNASAIDLAQFAGLNAERGEAPDDDGGYSELLAELRGASPAPVLRPFEVSLIGRWSEVASTAPAAKDRPPRTPLAGQPIEIAIEDAEGSRRQKLPSVAPGRRYTIGKGEGCEIVVSGVYASRRHCEIWFDRGKWWVTDIGSTNGVRVERAGAVLGRSGSQPKATPEAAIIEIAPGAHIVLSAHAEGSPLEYPRIAIDRVHETNATPIAPPLARDRSPATPATPILATGADEHALTIAAQTASGAHNVELRATELPFTIGRSRSQRLVVDWAHEGVSGHHADVTAIDAEGATVVVFGDNGVTVRGALYPPGSELRWKPGESMALGRTVANEPECRLTLVRRA